MPRRSAKAQEALDTLNMTKLLDAVAAGAPVRRAAQSMGLSEDQGYTLYHRALRQYYEENASARELLVARELRTLDLLQRAVMSDALKGDTKAVDRVLSIMERRAKTLGLDQAAKVSVEIGRADAALAEIVQIIDGTVAANAASLERMVLPEAG